MFETIALGGYGLSVVGGDRCRAAAGARAVAGPALRVRLPSDKSAAVAGQDGSRTADMYSNTPVQPLTWAHVDSHPERRQQGTTWGVPVVRIEGIRAEYCRIGSYASRASAKSIDYVTQHAAYQGHDDTNHPIVTSATPERRPFYEICVN